MSAPPADSVESPRQEIPGIMERLLAFLGPPGGLQRRFALGALWSVAGAILTTGTTQAASIISGRILGAGGLGVLALIQSTVVLGGVLGGSGIGLAATKHVAAARVRRDGEAGELVRAARLLAWAAGGFIAVVFYVCGTASSTLSHGRAEMSFVLRVSAPLVLLNAVIAIQQGVMAGFEDYRGIAMTNALRGVSVLVLTIILAPALGLEGAIWALAISSAAGLGLCEWEVRSLRQKTFAPGAWVDLLKTAKQLWRSALPMLVSGIAIGAGNWLTNVILAKSTRGFSELGQYYAADRWRLLCVFFSTYAGAAVLPYLSSTASLGDSAGFEKLARVNIRLTLTSTLPLALVTALLSKPLMSTYGASYTDAWPVLAVLAVTSVPTVLNSALGQVLVSKGRFWFRAACDIVLAAVALGFLLLPPSPASALKLAFSQVLSFTIVAAMAWISIHGTPSAKVSAMHVDQKVAP